MVASVNIYNGRMQVHTLSAFVRVVCELENYSYKLSNKARAKVARWTERIVQSLYEGGENRSLAMAYLRLLLDQVQKRHFRIPFDKQPCFQRPLCPLPSSLLLHSIDSLNNMDRQRFQFHIKWNRILKQLLDTPRLLTAMSSVKFQPGIANKSDEKEMNVTDSELGSIMANIEKLPISFLSRSANGLQEGRNQQFIFHSEVTKEPSVLHNAKAKNYLNVTRSDLEVANRNVNHLYHNDKVVPPYSEEHGISTNNPAIAAQHNQYSKTAYFQEGGEISQIKLSSSSCCHCSHKAIPIDIAEDSFHYDRIANIYRESSSKKVAIERRVMHIFQNSFNNA